MSEPTKLRGLYVMPRATWDEVYDHNARQRIDEVATMGYVDPAYLKDRLEELSQAEILVSSWGCPRLDQEFLDATPQLRAVFYGAGSLRPVVTEAFWRRDIPIVSARDAIAEGVTEFTLAQIALSLKHVWYFQRAMREAGQWVARPQAPGEVGSSVGLVSLGAVGRRVAQALAPSELSLMVHDPYADPEVVAKLALRLVSLEELFASCDVVSLHTPMLPETRGLVGTDLLASMKQGATLINTARGGLIDHDALAAVLTAREDLTALLDVTDPEPLPQDSPLLDRPNVFLTPHIAGNVGWQRHALGRGIADEVVRFSQGEPLRWVVREAGFARLA